MNIFLFDPLNLSSQAQAHPDKLVVKMQLEASQLLANTLNHFYNLQIPKKDSSPYKPTHINHPCSKWMCERELNAAYTLKYLESLIVEYERRYRKPSSFRSVVEYVRTHTPLGEISELPNSFAIAIPKMWLIEFCQDNLITHLEYLLIEAKSRANSELAKVLYTNYLLRAKTHYAEWRYSQPPEFWYNEKLSAHNGRFCKLLNV